MGIRQLHDHPDGKVCYQMSSPRQLSKGTIFQIGTEQFAAAFMGYTGSWYAYDLKTGQEIATFSRSFFERCIAPFLIGDLIADPDCQPAA